MKKTLISLTLLFVLFSVFSFGVFAQGYKLQNNQQDKLVIEENIKGGDITDLTQEEINGLLLMREEEKLARDVYLELYDQWKIKIFNNIASSEQTHTNAIKVLLSSYDIDDPVISEERGMFTNEKLSDLYSDLVNKGQDSLLDALIIGATIEDLDIKDLNDLLTKTNNEDIQLVYENLRKGSRNHLRSFYSLIEKNGGTYNAQYLTQDEIDSIISGEHEKGIILDENSNIIPNFESKFPAKRKNRPSIAESTTNIKRKVGSKNYFTLFQKNRKNFIESNGVISDCKLCDSITEDGNKIRAELSNGKSVEIKVMPDRASKKALERLKIKDCSEENFCQIELKEGQNMGKEARAIYEIKVQKQTRILGLFKTRMPIQVQVDAETEDVLNINKPWWAFLSF